MRAIIILSDTYGVQECLVDDCNYVKAKQHTWSLRKNGRTFYPTTNIKRDGKWTKITMHKMLFPSPAGTVPNHIDHNGLNNTAANIEFISQRKNQQDQQPQINKSSKYRGVHWKGKSSKWCSTIGVRQTDGTCKTKYLGLFVNEEEAALAWNKAADALGFHGYRNKIPNKP